MLCDIKQDAAAQSPLLLAAENGHERIVELLIAIGADQTVKDNDGSNLLHTAAFGLVELITLKYILISWAHKQAKYYI